MSEQERLELEMADSAAAEPETPEKKEVYWKGLNPENRKEIMEFADDYMAFLNQAKTEREATREIIRMAEASSFKNIEQVTELRPGDRVYAVNHNKAVYLAVIGKNPLTTGFHGVGAHIDSPRLDLKMNPVYEDSGLVMLKTHYYGGIKKYQWTTIPLALHGVVVKTDGTVIEIRIGEEENDPVFLVTDLLPHLAAKQNNKKLAAGVSGEQLNLLCGSIPDMETEEKEAVKAAVLAFLKEQYDIEESDLLSAEIEAVPAAKARDLGFDRSMVAGYGQDDRVCAYPGLRAILDVETPEQTAVCILADKEEIGSVGNTGMQSNHFELFMMDLLEKSGIVSPYALQRTFSASSVLSADVTAAFDPNYPEVMEKRNSAFMGRGIGIVKYTGARGKSGASDANAEFVGAVRGLFDAAGVTYQFAELGKVDEGGGGTIAYILANRGMEVLDCGVPVLSMHSPYETASKYDIYMAYKAYRAFLNR